ncbi:hypothetical protein JCM10212_005177 [Sporobolomyces blumeae]
MDATANPLPALPDLDSLRPRLAQTITAISLLTDHLAYLLHTSPPTHPQTLPFPDLLNRYNLLVTHLNALATTLSSVNDLERERDRERLDLAAASSSYTGTNGTTTRRRRRDDARDPKRDRWDSVAVVPSGPVDEAKDWIVGLLSRTKQTPQVEEYQADTLAQLARLANSPSNPLRSTSASVVSTSAPSSKAPPVRLSSQVLASKTADYTRLVNAAYDRVCALKEFAAAQPGDGGVQEEWDWKGRIGLDEEDEEDEGEGDDARDRDAMQVDPVVSGAQDPSTASQAGGTESRGWTEDEVALYLRTGKRPT